MKTSCYTNVLMMLDRAVCLVSQQKPRFFHPFYRLFHSTCQSSWKLRDGSKPAWSRQDKVSSLKSHGAFEKEGEKRPSFQQKGFYKRRHTKLDPSRVGLDEFVDEFLTSSTLQKACRLFNVEPSDLSKAKKSFKTHLSRESLVNKKQLVQLEKCGDSAQRTLLAEFLDHLNKESNYQSDLLDNLIEASNISQPSNWFPDTRLVKRKIIMHVGPTNSGKTYNALKQLSASKSGVYAGPLRLLAHEVYEKLNQNGIPCNLVTGEEVRETEGVEKYACTVEMSLMRKKFDVAVIDEIQMMADPARGWAWTQALLGINAKEIHLCGEPTAVDLVKRICASLGEHVEVNNYERLSPLEVERTSLQGDVTKLQKGDCVISFSRTGIFHNRLLIESETKRKCAVVYGGLPSETRSEQAKLFNDQNSGYDILVASDAVGMGLNLQKFDGQTIRLLTASELKQIAGRAGRYGTTHEGGRVTCLNPEDLGHIKKCIGTPMVPLTHAGIHMTYEIVQEFAMQLPNESLCSLMDRFEVLARAGGLYFLCSMKEMRNIALLIEPIAGLSLKDRFTFCSAPCAVKDEKDRDDVMPKAMYAFALAKSKDETCHLGSLIRLPESLPHDLDSLYKLEVMHRVVLLYLWLSIRFPDTFTATASALQLKYQCEEMINESLLTIKLRRRTGFSSRETSPSLPRKKIIPNVQY